MYKRSLSVFLIMAALTIAFFFIRLLLELGWGLLWDGVRLRGMSGYLAVLLEWIPILLAYIGCGVIAQRFIEKETRIFWISIIGIASTALIVLTTEVQFSEHANRLTKNVLYLYYVMPIIGVIIGYSLGTKVNKT